LEFLSVWRCRVCGLVVREIPKTGIRFCPKCGAWVPPESIRQLHQAPKRETGTAAEEIKSLADLTSNLVAALSDEIEHLNKEGGSARYILRRGELVNRIGSLYIYRFHFEGEPLQDDMPAGLRIAGVSDKISAEIISVEGLDVLISVEKHLGQTIAEAEIFMDPIFLLEILKERIEKSKEMRAFNHNIASYLFGIEVPHLSESHFEAPHLNEFQNKAVAKALGSNVFYIWGPPGTGKTTTLAALVQEAFRNGETLLVASNTNVAVDTALTKAEEEIRRDPGYSLGEIVRFGTPQAQDFPETLLPSKIAARRSAELDSKIADLQTEMSHLSIQLDVKQKLLKKAREVSKVCAQISANDQQQFMYSQALSLQEQRLRQLENQLLTARSASTLTRIIKRLDPSKLEREVRAAGMQLNQAKVRLDELQAGKQVLSKRHSDLVRELAGETEQSLLAEIPSIENQVRALRKEIEELQRRRQEMEQAIIQKARIVGATLAKSWLRREIYQRGFDSVIVDEASMATLPMLYFVCALAKKRTVLAGDFKQLPAIVQSDSENARRWLKRNIFESTGIVDAGESSPRLEMLRRQYRMNPQISALVNKHVYDGKLLDDDSVIEKAESKSNLPPGHGYALVLCDTSGLKPWSALKKGTHSRINLVHASIAVQLAKVAKSSGFTEIGIITPYRAQARFIRKLAGDSGFEKEVEVATVHRFQGREKQIIIFDISDSEPHNPSRLVAGASTDHLRLLNVAISRAQDKLVLIADLDYVGRRIPVQELLAKILLDVRSNGKIIDGRELLELREGEVRHTVEKAKSIAHFSQDDFYPTFEHDILEAKEHITIICPFVTGRRVETLASSISKATHRKVEVAVITREPKSYLDEGSAARRSAEEGISKLHSLGVKVKFAPEKPLPLHQKIAVIDEKILWHGSLNILSHRDTAESMLRLEGERAPLQLLRDLEAAPPKKIVPTEIGKISPSMRGVTVEGTVVDLTTARTVKTKRGELTTVATSTLSDGHDTIKLTLWGAQVYQIKRGSRIRIVNGYTSMYEGELVVQTGKYGRIEAVSPRGKE